MSWAKISDDFADDCETLSDAAFRLHVEGLCWNGRKLLDCRIPVAHLRRFAKNPSAVDELLAVGWWSRDGDVFVIRHHAAYQRLREDVLKQQAANKVNGSKGGRPRGSKKTHSLSDSVSDSVSANRTEITAAATPPHEKTHSLSDSKTERDRTGQDRLLGGSVVATQQDETEDEASAFAEFLPSTAVAS